MKLYYSAGSCSTSCHISLEESGLPYEAVEVDWDNPKDPSVGTVAKLNPLGTLPILVLTDGKQLDQNLAIHTYIADQAPSKQLLPQAGTWERAEAMNWLAFVTSDLHKGIGALFGLPGISQDEAVKSAVRKYMVDRAGEYIGYLDRRLTGREFVLGRNFSVVDSYAFVVLGWTKYLEIPLTPYKNIQAFLSRVAERPAVATVLKEEGLI